MTQRLFVIVLAVTLAGCAALGDLTLPSKQEVATALQAVFDGYLASAAKKPGSGHAKSESAPKIAALEVTKWKLIRNTYLVADVRVILSDTSKVAATAEPHPANFRLLLRRRATSWVLLDLVPIAEPWTVET